LGLPCRPIHRVGGPRRRVLCDRPPSPADLPCGRPRGNLGALSLSDAINSANADRSYSGSQKH
jgi:hypothetical protein